MILKRPGNWIDAHCHLADPRLESITNFNRQLHALNKMVGRLKVEVIAERLESINPRIHLRSLPMFYNAETASTIFSERPDFVIDAIDNMTAKAHLIHTCAVEKIPLVVSTGSGGRLDPTQVIIDDLAFTSVDPLARELRKVLRQKYDFPIDITIPFGIPSVFSKEAATPPFELHYDNGKRFQCVCPQGDNPYFNCEKRNVVMGNAGFVTGAFGLTCASVAVKHLLVKA